MEFHVVLKICTDFLKRKKIAVIQFRAPRNMEMSFILSVKVKLLIFKKHGSWKFGHGPPITIISKVLYN